MESPETFEVLTKKFEVLTKKYEDALAERKRKKELSWEEMENVRAVLAEEKRKEELSWEDWVGQRLPTQPAVFTTPHVSSDRDKGVMVTETYEWKSFNEEVICHVNGFESTDARCVRNFDALEGASLETYHTILIATGIFVGAMIRYSEFKGLKYVAPKSRPAKGNAAALANKTATAGIEVQKGSNPFLVIDIKTASAFRRSAASPPDDLVPKRKCSEIHLSLLRQMMKYLRTIDVKYGVITSLDVTYFLRRRRDEDGGAFNSLEISNGICSDLSHPSLIGAMHYIFTLALDDIGNSYEVKSRRERLVGSLNEDDSSTDGDEDKPPPPPDERPARDSRLLGTKRYNLRSSGRLQDAPAEEEHLHRSPVVTRWSGVSDFGKYKTDIAEKDLHLNRTAFATGWSGNLVLGEYNGQRIVVKLAPPNCERQRALEHEAIVYYFLRDLWGKYVPKLIAHGTISSEEQFRLFLATEFVDGRTLEDSFITQAVATEARTALAKLHSHGILHGDVHGKNIIVSEEEDVKFLDFGFSSFITSTIECEEEMELLERIIQNHE